MVPLTEIAKRAGQPQDVIKGALWGRGIELQQVGTALCVSSQDADQLVNELQARPVPRRRRATSVAG